MSDCWHQQHLAAFIGSLLALFCGWIGRSAWSSPAEKSCRFNLHTLKVAFDRAKAIPHSLLNVRTVCFYCWLTGTGDLPGWLAECNGQSTAYLKVSLYDNSGRTHGSGIVEMELL